MTTRKPTPTATTGLSRRDVLKLTALTLTAGCGGRESPTPAGPKDPSSPATKKTTGPSNGSAPVSGWGDLSGRFVFGGDASPRKKLEITEDKKYCCQHNLLDESLIVHEENRGLADVVVALYLPRGAAGPTVHSSYEETANAKVELNNFKCRFDPHVLLLRTTQSMVVMAGDPFISNVRMAPAANRPINHVVPPGTKREFKFPRAERSPCHLTCPVHNWESAWIVIKDHPYFAVSDENGNFRITNLPAGRRTFKVWHERPGYVTKVTINGQQTQWSKGRVTLDIKPGENDLGVIELAPELFVP